eukprot:10019028-Prorocentrum_lima.AAC.1
MKEVPLEPGAVPKGAPTVREVSVCIQGSTELLLLVRQALVASEGGLGLKGEKALWALPGAGRRHR